MGCNINFGLESHRSRLARRTAFLVEGQDCCTVRNHFIVPISAFADLYPVLGELIRAATNAGGRHEQLASLDIHEACALFRGLYCLVITT